MVNGWHSSTSMVKPVSEASSTGPHASDGIRAITATRNNVKKTAVPRCFIMFHILIFLPPYPFTEKFNLPYNLIPTDYYFKYNGGFIWRQFLVASDWLE